MARKRSIIATTAAEVSDWITYTPVISNQQGWVAGPCYWRRVGSAMEIKGRINYSSALDAYTMRIGLPTGYTIGAIGSGADSNVVGSACFNDYGNQIYPEGMLYTRTGVGYVEVAKIPGLHGSSSFCYATEPFTWGVNDYITFQCSIPIAQWNASQFVPNVSITVFLNNIVKLTSGSGTWTVPSGIYKIKVTVVGGGGGGGASYNGSGYGGGGGGGTIISNVIAAVIDVTPNQGISYSVGAGGMSNSNGNNSTFGAITGYGGGAGAVGLLSYPGDGGLAPNSDGGVPGQSGTSVVQNPYQSGGHGGGAGGFGGLAGVPGGNPGDNGKYGGGGGGGGRGATGGAGGGQGGSGIIIIEY
jgi:hypothetical protein